MRRLRVSAHIYRTPPATSRPACLWRLAHLPPSIGGATPQPPVRTWSAGDSDFTSFISKAKLLVEKSRAQIVWNLIRGLSIEEKEKLLWIENHKGRKPVEKQDIMDIEAETDAEIAKREKAKLYLQQWSRNNREGPSSPTAPLTDAKDGRDMENSSDDIEGDGDRVSDGTVSVNDKAVPEGERVWDPKTGQLHVEDDPILGKLICDLEYKRLYTIEIPALTRIPVWDNNRHYKQERSHRIAKDLKANKNRRIILPGLITIYEKEWEKQAVPTTALLDNLEELQKARKRFGILDGQHRVGALKKLHDDGDYLKPVEIEVIRLEGEEQVRDLFNDINKAEPVQPVDKASKSKLSEKDREILQSAVCSLKAEYPKFFSTSLNCRIPHLHQDKLRNMLFEANVLRRFNIKTDVDLFAWLLSENDAIAKKDDSKLTSKSPTKLEKNALKKSREHGFYLGMDRSWLTSDADVDDDY
uniref:Uncharacterized protein n=1 Tax=Octactis speculum TaxID=3111310 RepID=A0A7S2AIA4_9STRA|mmetsp:Transcript_10387/g.13648  ORF Transcript_10387/g.13648 Transcript_10387/m.13648 type:complete len:470 (+) Transcript_10387:79-1488(+)